MDDGGANAPTQVSLPDAPGAKAVVSPALISPTSQEQTTPMLDVHSPHETVRSWKESFAHIAIITIGLLIAIGLEQTVEHIHHNYQLNEARRELKIELEANRKQLEKNLMAAQQLVAQLDSNMALLRAAQASHSAIGPEAALSMCELTTRKRPFATGGPRKCYADSCFCGRSSERDLRVLRSLSVMSEFLTRVRVSKNVFGQAKTHDARPAGSLPAAPRLDTRACDFGLKRITGA